MATIGITRWMLMKGPPISENKKLEIASTILGVDKLAEVTFYEVGIIRITASMSDDKFRRMLEWLKTNSGYEQVK